MKKILTIFLFAFMLLGCNSEVKTKSITYELNQANTKSIVKLRFSGNHIYHYTYEYEIESELEDVSKEDSKKRIALFQKLYNLDGLSYSEEIKDESIKQITTIDFKKADVIKVSKIGIAPLISVNTNEDEQYAVYDKTVDNLEKKGFRLK